MTDAIEQATPSTHTPLFLPGDFSAGWQMKPSPSKILPQGMNMQVDLRDAPGATSSSGKPVRRNS